MRAADLAAYASVTDPGGPAMTWSMFAIGGIETGASAAAVDALFNASFQANAAPPFYVWFEEVKSGGSPNFLTGT